MKDKVNRNILFGVLLLLAIVSSGCQTTAGEQLHDSAINKFPTYSKTISEWDGVPKGFGRLVVFFPKVINIARLEPIYRAFIIDKSIKGFLSDQTFVFTDLPVGKHSIESLGEIFGPSPVEFEIRTGKITYINYFGSEFELLSQNNAKGLLENIHHFYEEPFPFDRQGDHGVFLRYYLYRPYFYKW